MSIYPLADTVHPSIDAAAQVMTAAGWRVTSIIRPNSEVHASGRAADFAPWKYTPTNVGPRTAVRVATLLQSQLPHHTPLIVVAEPDHIHCEVSPDGHWRVGTLANTPGRPMEIKKMRTLPDGSIILEQSDITRNPEQLGNRALGDPSVFDELGDVTPEYGDAHASPYKAFEMLDPEIADLVGEDGDAEVGGLFRRKKKKKVTKASLRRALRSANPAARAAALNVVSQLALHAPRTTNDLLQEAAANANAPGEGFPFIYPDTKGLVYSGGTISAERRMRPSDSMAILTSALSGPKFAFRNFAFTVNGANFELDVDSALAAVLPAATVFPFVGIALYATPTALNAQLDGPLSITVEQGAGNSMTCNFVSPEKVKGFAAWITSAQILSDVATPFIVPVTVAAVATGNHTIVVSGLNVTNYNLTARFLMPGDHSVAHIIRALELNRS